MARILVIGSREWHAYYRVERGIKNAVTHFNSSYNESQVITLYADSERRRRVRGAESLARDVASQWCMNSMTFDALNAAQPDVCLMFMVPGEQDPRTQRIAMQAEKSGIPVWRYVQ